MLLISNILFIASLTLILLFELKVKSTSIVLWAGITVFFAIPHLLDSMYDNFEYQDSTIILATLFSLFFNITYFATRLLIIKINFKGLKYLDKYVSTHEENKYLNIILLSVILSAIFLCIHVYITFGSFLNFTWIDLFDNRDGIIYLLSSYLLSFSVSIVYITYSRKRYSYCAIGILSLIVILVISRVRANLIPIFLPLIVSFILNGTTFSSTLVRVIKSIFSGLLLLLCIMLFAAFRVFGDFSQDIDLQILFNVVFDLFTSKHSEFGLRNAFYLFVENNNEFEGFNLGLGYIRLLMIALPSFLAFGFKPIDFASYMSIAYAPESSVLGLNSMHPTIYGDSFANFNYLGIFLGIFWAFLIKFLDIMCKNRTLNIYSAATFSSVVYALTLVARGAIYNGLYSIFYVFLLNYFIFLFLQRNIRS